MQVKIRCVVMRGGTSRGLFFRREDLPRDESSWTQSFCAAMGTPDLKQVDGLGGGTSSTSKVVVVNKSKRPGIDVDYTCVQVGVDRVIADIRGDCGNLSAAVGPFAVDEGMVEAVEPYSEINMFNTSTGKKLKAKVAVCAGKFDPKGECAISGLVQKGSEIRIDYLDPTGTMTGRLLPTGRAMDNVIFEGAGYRITVLDCTNPYVFILAGDLGMTGSELPSQIDSSVQLRVLQAIRDLVAERLGITGPSFPKIVVVARPESCTASDGQLSEPGTDDLVARAVSLGRAHKTIPLTAALCLAAAATIPGTLPESLLPDRSSIGAGVRAFRVGHPEGSMAVSVETQVSEEGGLLVTKVTGIRTARRIMEGFIYV